MNAQIKIQQPMQKASEMTIENLDHLGLVAGLVDDLGIVEKINELYQFPKIVLHLASANFVS